MVIIFLTLLLSLSLLNPAYSADKLFGPYHHNKLLRIIDGDTMEMDLNIFPDLFVRYSLRIDGVNTPETRTTLKCEKVAGLAAKEFAEEWFKQHPEFIVYDIKYGKFAGRVLGKVRTNKGIDYGTALIAAGHAKEYHGEKREAWCEDKHE